eukprot:GFUD01014383.1.p1 GENE.GFUD01014383.1~~GFUD01014383.1.p1  ORF type:complete len:620 (+),score=102.99 GFUD01014383.1:17-1876(+)
MFVVCIIFSQLIQLITASNSTYTQLSFDKDGQCIEKVTKVGTSKRLIVPQYLENGAFPEKLRIYHEYPIKTDNDEVFSEKGAVKYTVELKGEKGRQLDVPVENASFIIDSFIGVKLPRQNPKLRWIFVGDVEVPQVCLPLLTMTGYISKSCGQEEGVRVARSPFRGKVKIVSNWIKEHLATVKIEKKGSLVQITDWGKLTKLAISPCKDQNMRVMVQTYFYNQQNNRVLGPTSSSKQVKLRDLPETLEFTLENYPGNFHCYSLLVTLNIKTDFEHETLQNIFNLEDDIIGHPSPGEFQPISDIKCNVKIGEDLTILIDSIEGHEECLSELVIYSLDNTKLLVLNVTLNGSMKITNSEVDFCQNPVLRISFNDIQNRPIRSNIHVNLLKLINEDQKLFIEPVNDQILKDCGDIFRLTVFCKNDPEEDEEVFTITRYLYVYKDFFLQFQEEMKGKHCSLSRGRPDDKWVYIGEHATYDYNEEDYGDVQQNDTAKDCHQSFSILSICSGILFLLVILLGAGSLMLWWRGKRVLENVAEVIELETKDTQPENIYSSMNRQKAFNPEFVDQELGRIYTIEKCGTRDQDNEEDGSVSVRKRGSVPVHILMRSGSVNPTFDYHDGD